MNDWTGTIRALGDMFYLVAAIVTLVTVLNHRSDD